MHITNLSGRGNLGWSDMLLNGSKQAWQGNRTQVLLLINLRARYQTARLQPPAEGGK
jgi:hypothetical protein